MQSSHRRSSGKDTFWCRLFWKRAEWRSPYFVFQSFLLKQRAGLWKGPSSRQTRPRRADAASGIPALRGIFASRARQSLPAAPKAAWILYRSTLRLLPCFCFSAHGSGEKAVSAVVHGHHGAHEFRFVHRVGDALRFGQIIRFKLRMAL